VAQAISGYPGFDDLQDFFYLDLATLKIYIILSESGYPGFDDLQDFLSRFRRFKNFKV
jgi:hypothetical protein